MKHGKKGSFFVPIVVFGAIITLISLLAILFTKTDNVEATGALGEKQMALFNVYQRGEVLLNFIDSAAERAREAALIETARDGLGAAGCGEFEGTKLWESENMDETCSPIRQPCFPNEESGKEYFSNRFTRNLDDYINEYNRQEGLFGKLPTQNYEVTVSEHEFTGKAKNPITITDYATEIGKKTKKPSAIYSINPSFRLKLEVNFLSHMKRLLAASQETFRKSEAEARTAVENMQGVEGLNWELEYKKNEEKPCTRNAGPCSCCKTIEVCEETATDENSNEFCKKIGTAKEPVRDGNLIESTPYERISTLFKVKAPDAQFHFYDKGKISLTELEYKFASSWIKTSEDSTVFCSCTEGSAC